MIRRILLDHARRRKAEKRGGMATRLTLDEGLMAPAQRDVDLVSLDEALEKLAELDAQQAHVVELRFFAGLTIAEAAESLHISPATVHRDWITAKAWLFDQLSHTGGFAKVAE
jgi:RNA polymerase sigma factor (TIGR02999 family)